MTLGELTTDVVRALEETQGAPIRWSEADIQERINDGLAELSDGSEFYETYATITLLPDTTYYDLRTILPNTFLRLTSIWNERTSTWLNPADVRDLDAHTHSQWEIASGEVHRFLTRGLWWLGVFPKPNYAAKLRVYYRAVHPALVSSFDVPQQLPEDFHPALVSYALYSCLSDDKETTAALQHWQDYMAHEKALKLRVESRLTRPRVARMGG